MNREQVLRVVDRMGVFQLNPLAYRNDKTRKLLKALVSEGILVRQIVKRGLHNYTRAR